MPTNPFAQVQRRKITPANFGGGSDSSQNQLLAFILGQQSQLGKEQRALARKPIETALSASKGIQEQKLQQQVNFNKVVNLLKNTVAQQRARFEEQEKLPGITFGNENLEFGGLQKGIQGSALAALNIPGFERTRTTFGQQAETALALNSILTGQNRVIKGIIDRITKTLPGFADTPQSMAELISQTLRNSFGLVKALENAGFTKDVIASLSDEELQDDNSSINKFINSLEDEDLNNLLSLDEQEAIKQITDEVLATPAAQLQPSENVFTGFSKFRNPIPGSPGSNTNKYALGQILKVNGKRFEVVGIDDPSDPELQEVS